MDRMAITYTQHMVLTDLRKLPPPSLGRPQDARAPPRDVREDCGSVGPAAPHGGRALGGGLAGGRGMLIIIHI